MKKQKLKWLNRYRRAYYRVLDIETQLNACADINATHITGLPKASTNTTLDSILIHVEQLKAEYEEACRDLAVIRNEIVKAIDGMDNITEARLLYLKYICLLDWEQIQNTMHYTQSHLYRIHDSAIMRIDERK